jgi:hypothetical protein
LYGLCRSDVVTGSLLILIDVLRNEDDIPIDHFISWMTYDMMDYLHFLDDSYSDVVFRQEIIDCATGTTLAWPSKLRVLEYNPEDMMQPHVC